ncbi:MAG: FtsH protease activity modulator HflK [Luteimonas sp.]
MAWNIPGKNKDDDSGKSPRPQWRPRRGNDDGIAELLERLRSKLDDGGGGSLRWIGLLLALWLIFNCFVLIAEQQRGVVLRFGQFSRVLQPGPHLKLPWPIENVTKVNATQSQAFSDSVPVLTRDGNIVTVELNVQYRVNDPQLFLFGTRDAKQVLEQAALSSVREQVGRSDLDTVLRARGVLTDAVRKGLQVSLNAYRTGLIVSELNLQNARPPDEVKDAFDEAQRASADKQTAINQAQAYAADVVPRARGDAASLRAAAIGFRTSAIARSTGDAERFTLLQQQYAAAPEVTRKRLWLETVQQVLAENRKVIGGDGRQVIYVPMADAGSARTSSTLPMPALSADLIAPAVTATPARDDLRPARNPRSGNEEAMP